jgi:hypothetical protein
MKRATTRTSARAAVAAGASLLVAAGGLLVVSGTAASAASVEPTVIPGASNTDKTCAVQFPGTTELKADNNPQSQTLSDGVLSVNIVRPSVGTTNENSFDWTSNIDVLGVIVKNGDDGANRYDYSPSSSIGDTYLTTPFDGAKGISHISFCYVPVTLQGEIEVTKTAVPTFTREHNWKIDKTVTTKNEHLLDGVPKIWLYTDGSGDEKATWNVDVDYDGYTDSDWNVSGVITIKNTGDLPATVTSVLDNLQTQDRSTTPVTVENYEPDLTCPELPQDLAVGAELTCTYSQDLPSGLPGINIAGAFGYFDGDMTDKFNESTGPVRFAFGEPTTETNKTVNVKDVSDLFGEVSLGSVTAPNGDTFTYDKTFSWEDYGQAKCGSHKYDNTATIVETGQSDSARLKVNVQCYEFESAWAMGTGAGVTAKPFSQFGFSNWGWTNLIGQPYSGEWPLYAGAAQSDPAKGTLVGTFEVNYNGGFAYEFKVDPGLLLDGAGAVYAGKDPFPKLRTGAYTTAPGQYRIQSPLSGDIHVIAHANVGIPDPDFGPASN